MNMTANDIIKSIGEGGLARVQFFHISQKMTTIVQQPIMEENAIQIVDDNLGSHVELLLLILNGLLGGSKENHREHTSCSTKLKTKLSHSRRSQ